MTFGEKLAQLRTKHDLTQPDLSDALNKYAKKLKMQTDFTADMIKKWETDRNFPSMDRSIIISKFFSVTLDALFKPEQKVINSKIAFKSFILN